MTEEMIALARSTSADRLCKAWSLSPSAVRARKKGEQHLTIKEAGSLAQLHGLTLEDVLSF